MQSIKVLGSVKGILADLRVSVVNTPAVTISSGTVTTLSTVTTVSTLTNQAQQGGYLTNNLVQSQTNTNAVLSNINNINITP